MQNQGDALYAAAPKTPIGQDGHVPHVMLVYVSTIKKLVSENTIKNNVQKIFILEIKF